VTFDSKASWRLHYIAIAADFVRHIFFFSSSIRLTFATWRISCYSFLNLALKFPGT